MFNKTLHRPMFRKGGSTGSAGTGITSGLQAPRQGYDGDDGSFVSKLESTNAIDNYLKNNTEKNNSSLGNNTNIGNMTMEQMQAKTMEAFPDRKRSNKDLFIDFGLDLVSRPGSGGSIFENIGASGQKAYNQYRTANTAADSKLDDRRSDLFTSLIGAQAKMKGSEASGKTYNSIVIAEKLAEIIPKMSDIQSRIDAGTNTPEDITQMKILRAQRNNLSKSDVTTDAIIKMYTESNRTALGDKVEFLLTEDRKNQKESQKYTGPNDPQLLKDAVATIRKMFESFSYASGGRAGYANGEMVEEQVTETMDVGPMGQPDQADNPISYDQLRARLPQEISDDIVQLMSNSAEALEDFATIQTEQDIANFNKKYGVNLVLPAEG